MFIFVRDVVFLVVPVLPWWVFVVAGIGVVLFDLHTVNFIAPVGLGLIVFGLGLLAGMNSYLCVLVSAAVVAGSYYPFMKFVRKEVSQKQATAEDRLVGRVVRVVEEKNEEGMYRVVLDGEYYYAVSEDELKAGDSAVVVGIDGVKLVVKKVQ